MNTCCEKCGPYADEYFDCRECECHQEKPTHEIGWEKTKLDFKERLFVVLLDKHHIELPLEDFDFLLEPFKDTLTHQKESMVSKLKELEYTNGCSCNGECYPDKYNQALADAIEVILTTQ